MNLFRSEEHVRRWPMNPSEVDDYVLVHVGFAISTIDEDEAQRVFSYLDELGEIEDA